MLALIVLVLFGPKRLPELGRSLGSGIRHFRESLGGDHDDGAKPAHAPPGDEKAPREPAA